MKRLFYFVLIIAGFSSLHSCKDMVDDEGNPLIDLNQNSGLIGPRVLSREVTDAETIAGYQYNGVFLSKVNTPKGSVANIEWSGNKISRVLFNGFLDSDGDGTLDTDSTSYTQQLTYGDLGRLSQISENRTVYRRAEAGSYAVYEKTKAVYHLKYSSTTSKLESIEMKSGQDVIPFENTDYTKATYSYLGDNVSSVTKKIGKLVGELDVLTEQNVYDFTNYDSQISGYTLLPFEYKVSVLTSTKKNDKKSLILSPNSPRRTSVTNMLDPVPTPDLESTNYKYDPQTYMIQGFGVNYFYKPM